MNSSGATTSRLDRNGGFTLIDVLVTVSIVSLLVGLLLPAVQSARESARVVECKSNIKQLALACHSHHDVHGHFPTGGWGWLWVGDADRGFGKNQPGGWIFNLLPYFEQYALYGQASDGRPEELTRTQRAGAAAIIQTPLTVINCPTRRANVLYPMTANYASTFGGYFNSVTPFFAGRSDYAMNAGHMYCEWPVRAIGQGPRSYADARAWSANEYWGAALFEEAHNHNALTGVSYERSTISTARIPDGLSQTYLIGEKYIPAQDYETGLDGGDNETWCTGFNNDNYRRTGRLVGTQVGECLPLSDWNEGDNGFSGRFGASHSQGWNVATCGGSVRTMSFDIDWQVHRDSGNRLDGNQVGSP